MQEKDERCIFLFVRDMNKRINKDFKNPDNYDE